jgi:hypothetical protein
MMRLLNFHETGALMAAAGLNKGHRRACRVQGNSKLLQFAWYNVSALPAPLLLPGAQLEAV